MMLFESPRQKDMDDVFAFQVECDIAEFGTQDSSREDLEELWSEIDLARDAWLARDVAGNLTGYACVSDAGNGLQMDIYINMSASPSELEDEMMRSCITRAREVFSNEKKGQEAILTGYASSMNPRLQGVFERFGFVRHTYHYRMQIDFDASPAAVAWPLGFSINAYNPADESELYDLIETAFAREDREPTPIDLWRNLVFRGGRYDPELFVLVRDGGKLVGAALSYDEGDHGWIRQLAVRPGLQGQGLGGLLLRHMFTVFWQLSIPRVALGVAARNENAVRFYERAGMQRSREFIEYRLNIRP